jgi:predicted 3-demethylubiquinone-9 3-methyltransferase (glyoxalase superfamily)
MLGEVSAFGVEFELNGQKFFGLNGGPQHTFTEAISFQIFCDDQGEVDYYWSRLTDGGGVKRRPFGKTGTCTDNLSLSSSLCA